MNKDTINLRDEADFEIEVFSNVYWIPANTLGHTQYTEEDIKSMLLLNPNEKNNNLYEALQLYQISKK